MERGAEEKRGFWRYTINRRIGILINPKHFTGAYIDRKKL